MLKNLMILIVVCVQSSSFAQTWLDSGAKWTYDYWNVGEFGTYRWEYTNDSLFQAKNCQAIKQTKFAYGGPNPGINDLGYVFTYQSNDSVFYWKNDQFFLLYDFGAEIGDSWVIAINTWDEACQDTAIVQVMDTGTTSINGFLLRTLTLQTISNSFNGLSGVATERFGSPSGLSYGFLPGFQTCPGSEIVVDFDLLSFRCYQDDNFAVYNPSQMSCDTLTMTAEVTTDNSSIRLFPNPSSHLLSVESPNELVDYISFLDLNGSIVLFSSESKLIDLSSLNSGIYFVEIHVGKAVSLRRMLVKN